MATLTPQQFAEANFMLPGGSGGSNASPGIMHVAKLGDRWDLLAFTYYGDATLFAEIVAANPLLPITAMIPQGAVVFIPMIQQTVPASTSNPPWIVN